MSDSATCNIKDVVKNIKRWYREHGTLQFSEMTRDGLLKTDVHYGHLITVSQYN